MNKNSKIKNSTKNAITAILFITTLIISHTHAENKKTAEELEKMINDIDNTIKSSSKENANFEYPIERRPAAEYVIAEKSDQIVGEDGYVFICAVSKAIGQAQRAQTIVNVIYDTETWNGKKNVMVHLAPDAELCSEFDAIAIGFYIPSGNGWNIISNGKWMWLVRTSNIKVTAEEIEATKLRHAHKAEFKEKYGEFGYSEKLEEFIKNKLQRDPQYIKAGMWNDDFLKK